MRKSATWNRLLATTVISGLAALGATPALAQNEVRQPTQEATLGGDDPTVTDTAPETEGSAGTTITITGSRIARPDLTSTSPVTVVDSEQVQLTGTTTLETLMNDLPQVIPGNNRTSNNSGGFAFSTLDLRGLGPSRTLILVDGERLPASSASGVVDIAQVPVGLIERIDVVTGGATAVYGSDAVAGVVNFVLKQNFEGVELTGQVGIAQDGVGFNYSVSGLWGGNFDDGRGNIALYGSYFQREAVGQGRYDYSRVSAAICADAAGGFGTICDDPSEIPAGSAGFFGAGGSATPPWGQVNNSAANPFNIAAITAAFPGQFVTPAGCTPTGSNLSFNDAGQLTRYYGGGICGIPIRSNGSSRYNYAPDNFLSIPYDRLNFSALGRYEFTDNTRMRFFAAYTNTNSEVNLAPTPAAGGTGFVIDPVRVAASCVGAQAACALPTDLAFALGTRPNPTATFLYDRRFTETGPRVGKTEIQSFNGRITLEHDLGGEGDWRIFGGLGYGQTDIVSQSIGNINRIAVEQAIYGCRLSPTSPVNGPGIIPGCVPISIYGPNSISDAGRRFIQTDTTDYQEFSQARASVNVTGSLWELPGGPLGVAFGAEVRRDRGETVPDDAKIRGEIIGFNQQQPTRGAITAREVYGEVRAPILGGAGFPDLLAIELGARYSDYSSLQDPLFNWKAAIEFAPISWVRFRATYNKAARAPSVFELFQNGDQGFPAYTDVCNANRPGGPAPACSTGANGAPIVPAALLPTFQQNNSQVQAFAFGQPDLSEEKAETWTAGVVISPSRFPLGRFSMTLDYYDITLRGAVQGLSAQFYINQCYLSGDASACARIFRNPGTGQIDRVNTGRRNNPDTNGPIHLSGIDWTVNWVVPVADMFGGLGDGRIRFSNIFSWAWDYEVGGTDFVGIASSGLGGVTSEFANTMTLAYEEGPLTVQGRWVYKSGGEDDILGLSADRQGFAPRVPDLTYFDLSVRWAVSERLTVTGIVYNIFDTYPLQTVGGFSEQANTHVSFYSPLILGRSFSLQAIVRF